MLSPLKRHWDDVKGNAKWDAIKTLIQLIPFGGSLASVTASIKSAPWYYLLLLFLAAYAVFWLIAWLVGELVWNFRSPSLEVSLEADPAVFVEEAAVGCRLNIQNPHAKTLEIVSVEIDAMDTNPSHYKSTSGIPFPVELFPLEEQPKQLHPQEKWQIVFFENAKIVRRPGLEKHVLRIQIPRRLPLHLALNATYRLRIRILIRDFPALNERYVLRTGDYQPGFTAVYFSRIPRWKTIN